MRDRYDEQLRLLDSELKEMGAMCEEAIACAVKYIMDGNIESKKNAEEYEKQIDRTERDIEALCMRLLMRQQPLAADFRFITAALKMISDMERIGDHAEDIAEIGSYAGDTDRHIHSLITAMSRSVIKMLKASIDSYVSKNAVSAQSVIAMDDIVDRLFVEFKQELIGSIQSQSEDAEALLDLLMTAKYFERIGDHAENIAEWVLYAVTGAHKS